MGKLRILLADDHTMMRQGLRRVLEEQTDWEVVAETSDGAEAVRRAVELTPDIAILDITMPRLNGIEAARQMVYTTAWRHQNGEYPVREISMAKLHASRVAVEVADECIQIHGGAGYMREYGVERVWRDMRLNRIGAGTDEIMLDVIGRSYGL